MKSALRPLRRTMWSMAEPYAKCRLVRNYFGTKHGRRALLSYVVYPFVLPVSTLSHTNVLESTIMARSLSDLNYDVDIIHFDSERKLNYQEYDLIVGFGEPIVNAYYANSSHAVIVGFLAGMHNYYQNLATLARVKEVQERKNQWLLGSSRFVERDWTSIAELADAVVVLGNDTTADSYRHYVNRVPFVVPATYHHVCDADAIISERNVERAASTFLWFGGHGLVHKGLDLVLDAFIQTPQLHLHVCGPIAGEPAFAACFERELRRTPNITCHDFVPLNSPKFRTLMTQCAFVVYASCAEGGSSSVLTVAGNGGLIPVVSNASAVDIGNFGLKIADLTSGAVQEAVEAAASLSPAEIVRRSRASTSHYATENSAKRFAKTFERRIAQILVEREQS